MSSDNISEIGTYIEELLDNDVDLGFEDVWFGDENLIPNLPAASVDPSPGMTTELVETGRTVLNRFEFQVIVYHARQDEETEDARRSCLIFAEDVKKKLNNDPMLNGTAPDPLVHSGLVTSVRPGFVQFDKTTLMLATMLTWSGVSKTRRF